MAEPDTDDPSESRGHSTQEAGAQPGEAVDAPGAGGVEPKETSAHLPVRHSTPRLMAAVAAPVVTLGVGLAMAIPPFVALMVDAWAAIVSLAAVWRLVGLIRSGNALVSPLTPHYLRTLDAAGRAGFVASGYLALVFALMTLMAGLFGRWWGRLFIVPGAVFTVTALILLGIGVWLEAPVMGALGLPANWVIALGAYALADAAFVSAALVDARFTRSPITTGRIRAVRIPGRRTVHRSPSFRDELPA
ncbi:MAG TPA: hypothetical protein VF808_04655 [Ktedonobacterales bacterium]